MRHLAADGRPLLEPAELGALHLVELVPEPTAAMSPALAIEMRLEAGRVRVVHWIRGEPFRVVTVTGRA